MRKGLYGVPLALIVACILSVSACGESVQPKSNPTAQPSADVPPAWVQHEVAWAALAAGDSRPSLCQWTLVRPARAAFLASYLGRRFLPTQKVYVAVLSGQFTVDPFDRTLRTGASTLYLVLRANHEDIAHGPVVGPVDLTRLGALHSYRPQLPLFSGVWGHTMVARDPCHSAAQFPSPMPGWPSGRVDRPLPPVRRCRPCRQMRRASSSSTCRPASTPSGSCVHTAACMRRPS